MERDETLVRTTSKLEVISPKSTLGRSAENSRILAERRQKRERLHSDNLPAPQIVTRRSKTPIGVGVDSELTSEGSFVVGPGGDDQVPVSESEPFSLVGVITTLPSWLVSFVVHLALMLILAICTFSTDFKSPVFLEIAQISPERLDSMSIEIELDEVELDEMNESLELPESEPEIEMPELNDFEPITETFDQDEFEVEELAEFATPDSKPASGGGDDSGEDKAGAQADKGKKQGKATEFFGAKSYGANFVFVIDASSSMINNYRWTRAVRELLDTLDQLDDDKKFLVLLYNDRHYMMFGSPDDQKLISATDENKRRISDWLSRATPFGGTRPGRSMQLALKKKPDAIYFLSDGELRDNTMIDLRDWNRPRVGKDGLKRKISIHTILLGSNFGRLTMEAIAKENNGIFTAVN